MNLTSLAFVELYLPAQMGDFLARALSPPNESTSSFNVAFMSPLLAPFFPDLERCKIQRSDIFTQTCKAQPGIQSSFLLNVILDCVLVDFENFKHIVEAGDVVTIALDCCCG